MGYRFLLGLGVLGVTGLISVLQHDTISKSHGPYVIPLAVGTWLLWSPVRALLWGEGLQEPAYEVSSRKLARNNAARVRRTAHLSRVDGNLETDDRVFHDHYGEGVVTRAAADDGWWMIRFAGTPDEIRMSPSFTSLWAVPSESSAPS